MLPVRDVTNDIDYSDSAKAEPSLAKNGILPISRNIYLSFSSIVLLPQTVSSVPYSVYSAYLIAVHTRSTSTINQEHFH